jgi:peroxiredoxin
LVAAVVWAALVATALAGAAPAPPPEGGRLPEFRLPAPKEPADRDYLGLAPGAEFRPAEIRAEVLLIEIFSMYCPYCQKEAPAVNELFRMIERDPALTGRVKLIGIGAGNTAFEVDFFRSTYQVPFPLFADPDFTIHKRLGEVRTPYFIGARLAAGAAPVVFHSRLGGAKDAAELFRRMLRNSGLGAPPADGRLPRPAASRLAAAGSGWPRPPGWSDGGRAPW